MPKYYEDKPVTKRPCEGLKEDLKTCLLESDCVRLDKKTPKECLQRGTRVEQECRALQTAFSSVKDQYLTQEQGSEAERVIDEIKGLEQRINDLEKFWLTRFHTYMSGIMQTVQYSNGDVVQAVMAIACSLVYNIEVEPFHMLVFQ